MICGLKNIYKKTWRKPAAQQCCLSSQILSECNTVEVGGGKKNPNVRSHLSIIRDILFSTLMWKEPSLSDTHWGFFFSSTQRDEGCRKAYDCIWKGNILRGTPNIMKSTSFFMPNLSNKNESVSSAEKIGKTIPEKKVPMSFCDLIWQRAMPRRPSLHRRLFTELWRSWTGAQVLRANKGKVWKYAFGRVV